VRILVIEDEQKLGNALQEGLQAEQYAVVRANTGEEGFYLVQTEAFDLVLLDVMLPGRNGFEILTTMRRHGFKTPVLMLTAKDAVEDRVRGLDAGADDYLVKPFAFPELLAPEGVRRRPVRRCASRILRWMWWADPLHEPGKR
jgi:DNA-binding response OmpR family regulator